MKPLSPSAQIALTTDGRHFIPESVNGQTDAEPNVREAIRAVDDALTFGTSHALLAAYALAIHSN